MSDQVLSLLVHGPSKAGKSTLSFTLPAPFLILDAEGSTKFVNTAGFRSEKKIRKVYWDPKTSSPPRHDGTWEACVVNVGDWTTMKKAYDHLRVSPHDFRGMSLDSITEIQNKCKKNIKSAGQFQIQDWGVLLDEMDTLIRGLRDLLLENNTLQAALFIAETRMKDGKWKPHMKGSIETSMPYWVDICGYAFQDKDATGMRHLNLLAANHDQYEAGERVQGRLPDVILEPNIEQILNTVYNI